MINTKFSPYIIAEIGVNHNGSVKLAKKLINYASEAGVDAVKIQSYKTENLAKKNSPKAEYQKSIKKKDESHFKMLKRLELSFQDQLQLFKYAKKKQIDFISTPFDIESLDFLTKIGIKTIKVSSGDLTDLFLHEKIKDTGKNVIISTGMSNYQEIKRTLKIYKKNYLKKISLLHCVSNYPASLKSQNLNVIPKMKKFFRCKVGFSDHTKGSLASILAVVKGAEIIEKHITLDCNMPGPDHKASMNVKNLKEFVESLKNVKITLGKAIKKCQLEETKIKTISRKSIYYNKSLTKGKRLEKKDIHFLRPEKGLNPFEIKKIINKKILKDVKKGELVRKNNFKF